MGEFIKRVTADRFGGDRPRAPHVGAAVIAGTATAVVTYRLLRQ